MTQSPLESSKGNAFPPNLGWDRNFFLVMVGLAWVGIIKGFGGSIANHVAKHQAPYPLIVHFHAVVFVSWLVTSSVRRSVPNISSFSLTASTIPSLKKMIASPGRRERVNSS